MIVGWIFCFVEIVVGKISNPKDTWLVLRQARERVKPNVIQYHGGFHNLWQTWEEVETPAQGQILEEYLVFHFCIGNAWVEM